jgi:4-amino-4-deoxy-L-arabinose transferase-like glycosyltransferase
VTWFRWRVDPVLLAIVFVALGLRLQLAATEAYIHDEDRTAIPLSKTISVTPGQINLPLRGENHGALPAYVVRTSSAIFGETRLGYRALHVLLGLATVLLLARMARQWHGPQAAYWTAGLFAFNEYYLTISSRATAHVPHLFLVASALYLFSRFLATDRAAYVYAAGFAAGLAFYCKEHSALLLPVFFLTLLRAPYRARLRRPPVYLACAAFVLVITPDVLWNLRVSPQTARVAYSDQLVTHSTYRNHLARVGGLGLSPYPAMFYARDAVQAAHVAVAGQRIQDDTPEYNAMSPAIGILLFAGVILSTVRRSARDEFGGLLLVAFWFVFLFFTFIKKGQSVGRLDPASWIWVESTLIPATLMAGARLAELSGVSRAIAWAYGAAVLLYAGAVPLGSLAANARYGAEETVAAASHLVQVAASSSVVNVRERPLWFLGLALCVGIGLGLVVGFLCGWFLRARRGKPAVSSRGPRPTAGPPGAGDSSA